MSVVERCPLYGGVILCFTIFWDENICPLFGGVRCSEVSVNGGSTIYRNISMAFMTTLRRVHNVWCYVIRRLCELAFNYANVTLLHKDVRCKRHIIAPGC